MVLWIARWYHNEGTMKPEEALQDYLVLAMNSVLRSESKPVLHVASEAPPDALSLLRNHD